MAIEKRFKSKNFFRDVFISSSSLKLFKTFILSILYFEIDLWNKLNISNKLTREDLPHSYYQRLISCKDIKSPNIQIKIDYEKHVTGIEDEPFPNIEIVNV